MNANLQFSNTMTNHLLRFLQEAVDASQPAAAAATTSAQTLPDSGIVSTPDVQNVELGIILPDEASLQDAASCSDVEIKQEQLLTPDVLPDSKSDETFSFGMLVSFTLLSVQAAFF